MENLINLSILVVIALVGMYVFKGISIAAMHTKSTGKKIRRIIWKAMVIILTGTFGKILLPISFICYYITNSFMLKMLCIGILFMTVRLNFYGFRLHIIKPKQKAQQLNFFTNSINTK